MDDDTLPPVWDFEENFTCPQMKWKNELKKPEDFKFFLVMEGEVALQYAKEYLVKKDTLINEIVEIGLKMYEDKEHSLVTVTYFCNDDSLAVDVIDLLIPWIEMASDVVIFKSVPLVFYKTLNDIGDNSIIRALHTEYSNNKLSKIPILEQPNILGGVSAGVINYRDHIRKPASIYACYVQINACGLDSWTAKPIYDVLHDLKIPHSRHFEGKYKSYTGKLPSNLYM